MPLNVIKRSGIRIKEVLKARKERKKLLETLDTSDLIKFGLSEKNKTGDIDIKTLHIFTVGLIRHEEAAINMNQDEIDRKKGLKTEIRRLRLKLGLDKKKIIKIHRQEAEKHKGEGLGVGSMYYETAMRYISIMGKH